MFLRIALALGCFVSTATAQQPTPTAESNLDRIAAEVLKEMHNKGAALYDAKDHAGCSKICSTALQSVKPFLSHRPATQKAIADGLAEVEKLDGVKAQAYRTHELIVRIRTELQAGPKAVPAQVSGVLTLDGKPLAGVAVTLTGGQRSFTAITDVAGRFAITDPIPSRSYSVFVTGLSVPPRYQSSDASGIVLEVAAGKNSHDLNLQSK